MKKSKRATVYFDVDMHRAIRFKAVETDRSISDIVDEALRLYLREDAEDLADIRQRVAEPTISYEALIEEMSQAGEI
jgi:DTW domain-containing protein YfiP